MPASIKTLGLANDKEALCAPSLRKTAKNRAIRHAMLILNMVPILKDVLVLPWPARAKVEMISNTHPLVESETIRI